MSLHRAVLACVLVVAAACGADDRELREPAPDQTTTTRPPIDVPEDPDPGTEAIPAFELTTPAFAPNTMIPDRHTCLGADTSPPLSWANVPDSTAELALVVRDLSADGFVHWVVSGIDPNLSELDADAIPPDAVEARNDFGEVGWDGPCPPAGSGMHEYEFQLYALAESIGLVPGLDAEQAVEHIETSPAYGVAILRGTATG
jgi:Raf kinase inhibitor-like YbhB/YbcL family protein